MGKLRTIARRTFMFGSLAIAGGVAFGYYKYKQAIPNPLLDDLADEEAALTPFVKITKEGITLITPRADVGQGSYSVQLQMLAEELDIDPEQVSYSPGLPHDAYYNGALMREAVPFAPTDEGWMAEKMRDFMDVPAKFLGLQVTGGSSTVPDMFVRMRMAAASARETLKEAAAQHSGTPRDKLTTQNGKVILPDGNALTYEELAPIARDIEPIEVEELRPKSTWKHLSKQTKRIDIVAKSTGTQDYGIDVDLEGMVHATTRTNPDLGAGVKSMNTAAAESMPGVSKIIPITNGIGVIANNTWRAFQAANEIEIEWEDGTYPATSDEMWKQVEASFTEEHLDHCQKDIGDAEAGYNNATTAIDAEYRIPFLAHAPMEPINATALVTDERVDIWTGTQIPGIVKTHAAEKTGVPKENIYVHALYSGGSFGRRLEDDYIMQTLELAMAMKGTPVKMTWSREEDMAHTFPRPMAICRAKGSVEEGSVETCDLSIAAPSVTADWMARVMFEAPGPDVAITNGAWDQPFAIPHYRVTGYRAPPSVALSPWRSVGASGNAFFHASFLDELFHAAKLDPLDEMIRLCDDDTSRQVLEAVKEISNWSGGKMGENSGRGVAFTHSFGVPVAQVVEVTNTDDGIKIDKVFIVADVGQVLDPVNVEAQLYGGFIYGVGHAMNCEITYDEFMPEQTNFDTHDGLRISQTPETTVKVLENNKHIKGAGEPGTPPAAPALANAIFAATGKRIRELPLNKNIDFV